MSATRWNVAPVPGPGRLRYRNLASLYWIRLRHRWLQELLAVAGIAVGVALVYASQVATSSLTAPIEHLNETVVGRSQLQLVGRGPRGLSDRTYQEVRRLPGIRQAAPILQAQANLVGPRGERAVALSAADPRITRLSGSLLQGFTATEAAQQRLLVVPAPIARAIGVRFGDQVRVQLDGRSVSAPVAVAGRKDLRGLVDTATALAPLAYLQSLARLPHRLSRVLVEAEPGQVGAVRRQLERLAGDRLDVRTADFELKVFEQASKPTSQATTISSLVSAIVGFLFAFCAMLVTMASRRALAIDLRLDGYAPGQVLRILLVDALALGAAAVVVGLGLGELLSRRGFAADASFLGGAFPVGQERIVAWSSIALAVVAGLLAAVLGVLGPLYRVIFPREDDHESQVSGLPSRRGRIAPAAGVACLAASVVITVGVPHAALLGIAVLVLSLVLLLPAILAAVIAALARLSLRRPRAILSVELALPQLKAPEWRARSLAIAMTGAIAVFGAVALQGSRTNLQAGLDGVTYELSTAADVWVAPVGLGDLFGTLPFPPDTAPQLASVPGVHDVAWYRAGFMDIGDQRVWTMGVPVDAARPVPPAEVLEGGVRQATERIRAGGWATVPNVVAARLHLDVGDRYVLPSPVPIAVRVAAITTNIGWPGGTMVINAEDFARAWGSRAIGAYQVHLDPGISQERGRQIVARALGPHSALRATTPLGRRQHQNAASHGGLARLKQVASLTLIAAVLAMAAAMAGLLWQRRPTVARQKLDGHTTTAMWRALAVESGTLFGTGCLAGAVFALLGQVLFGRWLQVIGGFPVAGSVRIGVAAMSFALVTGVALLVVAIPGYLVARVPPSLRTGD